MVFRRLITLLTSSLSLALPAYCFAQTSGLQTSAPQPSSTIQASLLDPVKTPPAETAQWLKSVSDHFENQYAKTVRDPYTTRLVDARRTYLDKLETAISKAASAGTELEVTQLREERERFFNAGRMAPQGEAPCRSAQEIRAAFRSELAGMEKVRAASAKSLHSQFDPTLARAQTLLLQRGLSEAAAQIGLKRAEITRDWLQPAPTSPRGTSDTAPESAPSTNRAAVVAGVRWLLGLEGNISYFNGVKRVQVTEAKDWPAARVDIASISLSRPQKPVEFRRTDLKRLGPFRAVRELSINGFDVTDGDLGFLNDWRGLVRFAISGASVTDSLGQQLARFKTLLHLDLKNCSKLTPQVLVPLKESAEDLLSLQLDGNDFGDSCTEIIAQFQNLESLSLRETRLTNAGLANLARIRSLRHLNISNTHVTPEGLESLADLRLQSVSYLSTDMPDFETAAAALAKVQPRLESLSIAGSELRPEHAKALKLFRHLTRLDLLANAPQPGSMEELSDLHSLQNIRSISTAFSDPHLSALSQCSQIKVLDLSNTSITDKGVSKLRSLKELRVLHASNSISESTAQRLKRAVPGLTLYK